MNIWLWGLFILIICQRIVELVIAKKNERWMKARGGIEKNSHHHKWFVVVHTLFFVAILTEVFIKNTENISLNYSLLTLFILAQLGRIWCIQSLGRFWNTKIIVLPGVSLIKKGPYRFIKHPNYIIVGLELLIIPLLFNAFITAMIFPILHIILLTVRIPSEEKALNKIVKSSLESDG